MTDKPHRPLNEKQKAFCREYILNGWNGLQAYQKVYNCTPETAKANASDLLTKTNVKEYIVEVRKDTEALVGINKEKILQALTEIAFTSISQFNETWIKKIEFEALSKEAKACISEIEHRMNFVEVMVDVIDKKTGKVTGQRKQKKKIDEVRFKLYSRTDAIKEINKMMGNYAIIKTDITSDGKPL